MKSKNENVIIMSNSKKMDLEDLLLEKINFFNEIIKKTLLSCQKYKFMDIIGVNEINACTQSLEDNYDKLLLLKDMIQKGNMETSDSIITELQNVNNDISSTIKLFGTESFDDLLSVCFGHDFLKGILDETNNEKYRLISKYVHPTSYKVVSWKNNVQKKSTLIKNKIVEDSMISECADSFECFDLGRTTNIFQLKG